MVFFLTPEWFLAEYRRDSFWGHCYFYYILMTWRLLSHVNLFFMLTTQPFYFFGKDVNKIAEQLGDELSSLNGWLVDNRLSIHLGKTESILFGTKKRLGISSEKNVTCGETMVASTKSVRYLGVDLDQSLDGNYIAENILKKGNSRLKFLWRHAKFLNTNPRKLLASALIQCHFDYACSAWFIGLHKIYQQKLQILQNKTIRFVLNCSPRTHIGFNEFKIINWIPVSERVKQIKLNNMFRIIHGTAPKYLRDSFFMVSQEHDRYTRTSVQSLVLPHVKSAGAKSFRYSASKMWNRLPVHLRMQENFLTFKHAVRKHMWTELQDMKMEYIFNTSFSLYLHSVF